MARPTKDPHEKRGPTIRARVTEAERAFVQTQAAAAGLPVSDYVRRRVLGHVVSAPPKRADASLITELTRIGTRLAKAGNNLNQIARAANSGAVPLAVSVDPAVAENAAVLAELRSLLAEVAAEYGS